MNKKFVASISVLIFLLILAWDAWLYLDGVPGNSISQVIIEMSSKSHLVPFFIGFLMGGLALHWFDNYREPRQ